MTEALARTGAFLSEEIRNGLAEHGLCGELVVRAEEGRVSVVGLSEALWESEVGTRDVPPRAPVATIVHAACAAAVRRLRDHILEG